MWKHSILILLGLSSAQAVKLTGDNRIVACSSLFFERVLPHLAEGYLEGVLGSYQLLVPTLQSAGTNTKAATYAFTIIDRFISEANDPVVGDMKRVIDVTTTDETQLILCILKDDCRLSEQQLSRHLYVPGGPFRISSRGKGIKSAEPSPGVYQAIIANRIPNNDQVETIVWAISFLGELNHFATFRLMEEWIEANKKLIDQGLMADELFQRHVFGRTPTIDEGFVRVLMISRKERTNLTFYDFISRTDLTGKRAKERRQSAFQNMKSLWPLTKGVMKQYHIDTSNALEIGIQWAQQMRDTIHRASQLSAP